MLTRRTLCFSATAALAATTLRSPANAATHPALNPIAPQPGDWPWWRGPSLNGIAEAGQMPPVSWDDSRNILWKTPVPGRSHGSLTVVGPDVLLAVTYMAHRDGREKGLGFFGVRRDPALQRW